MARLFLLAALVFPRSFEQVGLALGFLLGGQLLLGDARGRMAVSLPAMLDFRRPAPDAGRQSAFSISATRRLASAKSSRAMACSLAITVIGIRSVNALDAGVGRLLSRNAR